MAESDSADGRRAGPSASGPRGKSLLLALAVAAGAGVYIEATRDRSAERTARPSGSPATSLSVPAASAEPPPPRRAAATAIEQTIVELERAVRPHASKAKQPWQLAHGLVAFGPELRADDGRSAIDAIASFAVKRPGAGAPAYAFEPRSGESLIEPHPHLLVKTLLEIGVPLDRRMTVADHTVLDLARLADDAARSAELTRDDAGWHRMPWLLSLLVEHRRREPKRAPPKGAPDLAELTRAALTRLEADQGVVSEAASAPERAFDPGTPLHSAKEKKQGIYGHACGGYHFIQAVISAVAFDGDAELLARTRRQLGVLIFRYEIERDAYARLLRDHPEHGLILRIQQLKFFGHLLETLGLARQLGVYDPATEGGQRIDQVSSTGAQDTIDAFVGLEQGGVYHRLDAIRAEREQTFLDLVGDACHAIRGLRRSLAARRASGSRVEPPDSGPASSLGTQPSPRSSQ